MTGKPKKTYLSLDDGLIFNPNGWDDDSSIDMLTQIVDVVEQRGPEYQMTIKMVLLTEEDLEDDEIDVVEDKCKVNTDRTRVSDYVDNHIYEEFRKMNITLEQALGMLVSKNQALS